MLDFKEWSLRIHWQIFIGHLLCVRNLWFTWKYSSILSFPGGSGIKESACQCRRRRRHGFDPWVRKVPRRRKWQPTPVFLPGESHGQRSLVGYSPCGYKELNMFEWLSMHSQVFLHCYITIWHLLYALWALGVSLIAQLVKNLPAMREIWVQFLGWEEPLEKGKATHSSNLAWRAPWAV